MVDCKHSKNCANHPDKCNRCSRNMRVVDYDYFEPKPHYNISVRKIHLTEEKEN